jgi:hypothetical protein
MKIASHVLNINIIASSSHQFIIHGAETLTARNSSHIAGAVNTAF